MNRLLRPWFAPLLLVAACSPTAVGGLPTADVSPTGDAVDAATDAPSTPDSTTMDVALDTPTKPDATPADAPDDLAQPDAQPPVDVPKTPDVPDTDVPVLTDVPVTPDVPVTDVPVVTDVPATDARVTCRSDRDCAATAQVCDTAQGACVDCVRDADCLTAGTSCISNRCTRPVACTSSRMCPGQVCDTARMLCVDCVSDTDCAATETCRASACVPRPAGCGSDAECAAPTPRCNATTRACVACLRDSDCGAGRTCTSANACVTTAVCSPGAAECVDSVTQRVCNATGTGYTTTTCAGAAGATATCRAGACGFTCNPGMGDCDGNAANGCEINGLTDVNNCGGCGVRCSTGDGGAAACVAGRCVTSIVCAAGRGDCDGNAANGCETDLTTSSLHCGRCGNSCGTSTCSAGACPRIIRTFGGSAGIGTSCLTSNDDGSYMAGDAGAASPIDLTATFRSGVNYYGSTFTTVYLNNNGNVTFRGALGTYTPAPFPVATQPMIAPWWGDVDTRGAGQPMRNNVCFAVTPTVAAFTWDRVGYFSSHDDRQNTFQLLLSPSASGATDFNVEFRYERCDWTTGDASGGVGGLGGTPAQAGFDAGNMTTSFTLPGSRTMSIVDLCNTSNVGTPGIWRFTVRSGVVAPGA